MSWEELPLDRIYYDATLGVPGTVWPIGTPSVPSNTIADVITMCAARNIHKIDVHGALTLSATMEHYCFFGSEHEDIADILDLSDEDVDGSHIEGLIVTGGQGGTGFLTLIRCIVNTLTLFQGQMNRCSFYAGTCSFKNASYIDLIDCESIYGAVTITVQAPTRASIKNWRGNLILTAQNGGLCHVRGFTGSLTINAMTVGTLNIFANGADITINVNCTGGTINIYGNARVTGAGGGVTINNYTIQVALDKLAGEETVGTHAHVNNLNWQTVFTLTTTTRRKVKSIWLNFVNLTQNMSYRLSYNFGGLGAYVVFDSNAAAPWTPALDDGVLIDCNFVIGNNLRLELQSAVLEGAARDIPYEVYEEPME